jgi:hypothetical protein
MNKKIFFTTAFIILGVIILNAQICTPEFHTTPGIYPDSVTDLPIAYASEAYSTTMTDVIPAAIQVATVDSIGITGITGMPAGFSYTPNTTSGYWAGGTSGCILISGNPSTAQVGTYPIVINTLAVTSIGNFPIPMSNYKIVVVDTSGSGIANVNMEKFNVYQNSPNPFSFKTNILFTSPVAEIFQFIVYNLLGEVVYKQSVNANTGNNKIEFSAANLPSGIYMYKLNNKAQTITRRMIIEGR